MAVSIFACPDCGSTLKSKQALAAGTKIRCPKCQTIFAIPERNGAAEADDEEAPPPSRPVAAAKEVARKAAPKPPPLRPRKEEFAEYDDGEDDEEEEVRPKKKKKFKGKKKSLAINPVLIGGIAGAVLLLAVGGVLGWVWPGFFIKLGNEPLAYIPPNSTMVMAADIEALIDRLGIGGTVNEYIQQIPAVPGQPKLADCKSTTGLEVKELYNQVIFATTAPLQQGNQTSDVHSMLVIKSKVPFQRDKVVQYFQMTGKEEKIKGKTVYKRSSPVSPRIILYIPTNQIIVLTPMSDSELEPILASRGIKSALLPETMQMVDSMRQSQAWAVVPFNADARQRIKDAVKSVPGEAGQDMKAFASALPNAKAAGGWLSVENNQVKLTLGLMCADADTAKKVSSEAQHSFDKETKGILGAAKMTAMLAFVPEPFRQLAQDLLASVRFTAEDATASVSVQANVASIKNLIQMLQQAGPGLFMGGAGGMPAGMNPNGPGGQPPAGPPRGGRRPGRPPK